ncbi:sensor histidine kinase [Aminipila sp.]|uniref:sensor histidine kinase n=1 Tax=Aminipila sp. TaxID=2060095 RepID=UPI002898703D|nr:HAMP domain-containing sensor histidine kinase [Aminipila sp.]
MNIHKFGIFGKVFLYTLLFLSLTISITVLVFAQQFKDFYDYLQVQQYTAMFEPLKMSIVKDEGIEQIVKTANEFHDKNQSFVFNIETQDGDIVYTTVNDKGITTTESHVVVTKDIATDSKNEGVEPIGKKNGGLVTSKSFSISKAEGIVTDSANRPRTVTISKKNQNNIEIALDDNLIISTVTVTDNKDLYEEFIKKGIFILFLLLLSSIAGAVLFARGITRPIRTLADDTCKMACLEEVSLPVSRRDEVGQLARDVHNMYEKLKYTISELQAEVIREREMEENQRYFFSAASHELKTPIAATSALLEGMIAGIGDYNNHPKYLRECLNMMRAQNRIITEILEIVKLSDKKIVPHKEKVILLHIIHYLLPEYNTLADKKEQSIFIEIPETTSCYTDPKMICNVFSNVVMNAIQNSSKGEEIRIWSEIRDNDIVRISILNTNAHIDEEIKAKLFEPFYRVDKARSRTQECGGLGLTIVKKILESLDVTFALETRNADIIFWMDLPISE